MSSVRLTSACVSLCFVIRLIASVLNLGDESAAENSVHGDAW